MNEAALKQLDKIKLEIATLEFILADQDAGKQRISMLVSGTPDLHIRNPELYEKMAKWANPKYKPYTSDVWMMQGMLGGGDIRERLPSFWVDAPEPKELPDGLKYLEK